MNLVRIAASDDNINAPAGTRVRGAYLYGGTGDSSALVFNELAVAGKTEKFGLKALLGTTSPYLDFGAQGILFDVGISVTLAGSGAVLYLAVD